MRTRVSVSLVLALVLAAGGCVTVAHPAAAQPPPEFTTGEYGEFYDALSPYGQWVYLAAYGWVWHPYGLAGDWRPYTMGHWLYAYDYGWTWVSSYAWGWAPFHYGRWILDPRYGWVWIPGHIWGPAWVAWRWGPGWVGWAPLPPQAYWDPAVGVVYRGGDYATYIHTGWWCFVPERRFLAPRVHRYLAHRNRNGVLIRQSRHRHTWRVTAGRPVNVGVPVREVERVVGHPVRPVRVIEADRAPRRGQPVRVRGNDLPVYRPPRLRGRPVTPARPGTPVRPGVRPQPQRPPAQPARPGVRPQPQPRRAAPARPAVRPQPRPQRPQGQPARPTYRPAPRQGAPAARPAPQRTREKVKKGQPAKKDEGKRNPKGKPAREERRGR